MEDRYLFKAKFDDSDRWVKWQLVEVMDKAIDIVKGGGVNGKEQS